VTYRTDDNGVIMNDLVCLNTDGSMRWKNDKFNGEILAPPGYDNGALYVSAIKVTWAGPGGGPDRFDYGKMYAIDASNGSVRWSYLDSNMGGATPLANKGEVYLPQQGKILGFDALSGKPNWLANVTDGRPFTPLIDGDTLYTATAPLNTAFYSITAINVKTKQPIWTTPVSNNTPIALKIAGSTLVMTTGTRGLMVLDKRSGAKKWDATDRQYDHHPVVIGNTLYAFNHEAPLNLYAFNLSTGGAVWNTHFSQSPTAVYDLYAYGKYLYFYGQENNNTTLHVLDPKTGDSVSSVTINDVYGAPVQVGSRVAAIKAWNWNNGLLEHLDKPRIVILDATNYGIKNTTEIDAVQINYLSVIGKSGRIW